MIQCINMKQYVSFLSVMIVAFGINYAHASECVGEECEILMPAIINQDIDATGGGEPVVYEEVLWSVHDEPQVCEDTCEWDYNCPFETYEECEVWYKKPVYNESVNPRARHLSPVKMDDILFAINTEKDFSGNSAAAAPLVERYKILMRASKACCTEGIIHKLHTIKAKDKNIYDFLKDDANRFAVGERCLVLTNDDIARTYSNGVNGEMVRDVRNTCLCKNKKWFQSLLAPFNDVYQRAPQFESTPFFYTYIDGMQRQITVSINDEVQKVVDMLQTCPD